MNTENKFKLLTIFSIVCIAGIAALGVYTWQMNKEINALKGTEKDLSMPSQQYDLDDRKEPVQRVDPRSPNWDPWAEMDRMKKQMDEMMESMPSRRYFDKDSFLSSNQNIEMKDNPKEYVIEIEVPENQLAEISTEINGNMLSIDGKLKSIRKRQDDGSFFKSQSESRFSRSMTLAEPIDEGKMRTEQKGNKIIITIPKKK